MNDKFEDIGLPVAPGIGSVDSISYCAAAKTLVAKVVMVGTEEWRFFLRREDEFKYREIETTDKNLIFRQFMVMPFDAGVGFMMLRNRSTMDSHVCVVMLPSGALSRLPDPVGYTSRRTWISQLLAASPDGTCLHVVAAEQVERDDGGYTVVYSVARMVVSSGHLTKLATLSTPFA